MGALYGHRSSALATSSHKHLQAETMLGALHIDMEETSNTLMLSYTRSLCGPVRAGRAPAAKGLWCVVTLTVVGGPALLTLLRLQNASSM